MIKRILYVFFAYSLDKKKINSQYVQYVLSIYLDEKRKIKSKYLFHKYKYCLDCYFKIHGKEKYEELGIYICNELDLREDRSRKKIDELLLNLLHEK
jgi:hypothetical protein